MLRIISALTLLLSLATVAPGALAQAVAPSANRPALAENAPDRHIVVPGDTLWGISGKFLKDPWRWPDLWRMNKDEVKNPHRIYPGDIIVLDRVNGVLRQATVVRLEPKVYSSGSQAEIPSIPPNVIDPFLSQPLVVSADALANAPSVVGTQEGRVRVGKSDQVFVRGISGEKIRLWSVYRPGKTFTDPDTGEVLGHEAVYLGTATLEVPGTMARLLVTSANQEISVGDRLAPTRLPPLIAYSPRKPESQIGARIIGLYNDGGVTGGQFSVITLNKGSQNGLEIGHVLAISRSGRSLESINADSVREVITFPDQRYGLAFVFRIFDRVSYALVMEAGGPLKLGDLVSNP